ncbi:polysaccharide deacetylase family protein [Lacibacter sediminis]|uniref:Polysaccharide deacetylase family protein n=1 Tax=Lacibacter sediminis TaxID=2760713 RepID=A0A7G5XEG4_9BACT|nr:polysaccharide deacetylase family protein [Lacibacter sediminis]QNA43867.1 polysaccharide deacetylase family protein [Lacibacter sediminis]
MLVYTPHITPRISYIIQLLNERWQIDVAVTDDLTLFQQSNDVKLVYAEERIDDSSLFLQSTGLLLQHDIRKQYITCFNWEDGKAFFQTTDDVGFDIFSAIFYLITRYEEYLEYEPDEYGRYAHWNSLAWKEGFLHQPIIDVWLMKFEAKLKQRYSLLTTHHSPFTFLPTYDIDIAWSYKHKGLLKTVGAVVMHPSTIAKRLRVLSGKETDPFDSYDWLQQLHEQYALQPIYFFLLAERNNEYDKNISPRKTALQQLIRSTAAKATVAIHPSTESAVNPTALKKEKEILQTIVRKPIPLTRNHYIQFHLPHSYRSLIVNGFTDEYSMGYGTVNGFRASTSHSFLWYDLEKEETTALRVHPFAYMDANSFYELHHSTEEALEEIKKLCSEVQAVNGTFITIFHNHMLGTDPMFKGWKEMYENFVATVISTKERSVEQ